MGNIVVKLPDNTEKQLPPDSTGLDLAKSIGSGLAKAAIAYTSDGIQKDLLDPLDNNSVVSLITINSNEGIEIMRHTLTAQVLALAVKNLYPDSKLAIGPTIDNGFYYDFSFKNTFSIEDLDKVEKEMRNIIQSQSVITKLLFSKKDAINLFNEIDEPFKAEIIESSDQEDNFQIYKQEETGFIDLCKGPHLPSLKMIGEFKLTHVSGAYWRGDASQPMLTRIYGTAWNTKKELNKYLQQLKEAEVRDHRKLGKEMNLFHFQDDAPGMVFWHPAGWIIYNELQNYMRKMQTNSGYEEIRTPEVLDRKLWEKSGHWDKYRENMYITEIDEEHANEKRVNALKPMNCPCHVQVYNYGLKSYKDLPVRFTEFGSLHRYEPSGTMHGLMRVRSFTQDDGHIFCTEDQIESETKNFIQLLSKVYEDLGFTDFVIKLSTRPDKRMGSNEIWDKSEKALQDAIEKLDLKYQIDEGGGAFYGPKLDFVLTDAIGRDWQCGTLQADFNLPGRFNSTYVNEKGNKSVPVLLHRAVLGSFERFIGIILENYGGNLPFWLAPTQVVITTITDAANEYAVTLFNLLKSNNIRVKLDNRNEQISYKIREHSLLKVPHILIVGTNEVEENKVSIRSFGSEKTISMSVEEFLADCVSKHQNPS
ncbi:threonine--tRNA ligase [SAR86 cluster bacterium]|nr:threonine--tRNA ligase [SAR86 cluster bacterium]